MFAVIECEEDDVTSREGRVSRNFVFVFSFVVITCHVPRGACE